MPAMFGLTWLALPVWRASRVELAVGVGRLSLATCSSRLARRPGLRELREVRRGDARRAALPLGLRGALVGRARRVRDPVGRRLLGLARADAGDHRAPSRRVHEALDRVRRPGRRARHGSGCRTCSSSRSSSARACASACGRSATWLAMIARARQHDRADDVLGRRRPARATGDRGRLPAAERRPALAAAALPRTPGSDRGSSRARAARRTRRAACAGTCRPAASARAGSRTPRRAASCRRRASSGCTRRRRRAARRARRAA